MFATVGYIVPEYTRLPGFLSHSYGVKFVDVPNGLNALSKVLALGVPDRGVCLLGGVEHL
jgi:hypothetical protein